VTAAHVYYRRHDVGLHRASEGRMRDDRCTLRADCGECGRRDGIWHGDVVFRDYAIRTMPICDENVNS
jgi:hypothetical protein